MFAIPCMSNAEKVKAIDEDGWFVLYNNDVVKDTKTGLEWIAGPDRDTSWYKTKKWVEELATGARGWRMPTAAELRTLYQPGVGIRNMTPLLKTTGWRVWLNDNSSTKRASYFSFIDARIVYYFKIRYKTFRGFAVRSRR